MLLVSCCIIQKLFIYTYLFTLIVCILLNNFVKEDRSITGNFY